MQSARTVGELPSSCLSHSDPAWRIPTGRVGLRRVKNTLEHYLYNPSADCRNHKLLLHARYRHAKAQVLELQAQGKRHISLDTECVVYVIYHRKHSHRRYVGLTYRSAWERFKSHLADARAHMRRPKEAHNLYDMSHQLYRIMGRFGVGDLGLMVLEVCGRPSDYSDYKDFAKRNADLERWWINTLDATAPNGYNIRNTSWLKRNHNRREAVARRVRVKAAKGAALAPHDSSSVAPAPPQSPPAIPLPHPSFGVTPAHQETVQQAPLPAPAGGIRRASYARTAYYILQSQRPGDRGLPLRERLHAASLDQSMGAHMHRLRRSTLTTALQLVREFGVGKLNATRPKHAVFTWTLDDARFVAEFITSYVQHQVRQQAHGQAQHQPGTLHRPRIFVARFGTPALDKARIQSVFHRPDVVSCLSEAEWA